MPINRLLKGAAATPEEIARLNEAYDRALRSLGLVDRNDPLTEIVAQRVIEIGGTIRDPIRISQLAVESLRL